MKKLQLLLLSLLFLALGAALAVFFNLTMGVSVKSRAVMPEKPAVSHDRSDSRSALPLPWVMFDPGAVGIEADTAAWQLADFDHEQRRFTSLYKPAPEYYDSVKLKLYRSDLIEYLGIIRTMGGTALEFPMFLELVDFNHVGTGFEVYPEDDPMRQRQAAYRQAFGSLFEAVDSMGFDLVLSTDMVALTPAIEKYLQDHATNMNTADPVFWDMYKSGVMELFERFPMVDALQIRVGEAGSFYNRPNWPYRSELWVDDIDEVQAMLTSLLSACKLKGKKLIFRSWTIGMGSVGGLHTDTAVYNSVFKELDDPDLWISTKWVQGDFYPFTPYNPTLSVGAQSRIIEFQARREYEAFCSYPLWIVPYEQYALQRAVADNQNIKGFWIWTMYGGPIRRSPMSLFPHTGDLTWISLNAAGTAALAKDPYLDTDSLLTVFLEERFNPDTIAMKVLKDLLNDSHHISRSGLAFPTAVNNSIRGLGTDVPDGIYTYWDLVLASTAVNSILYYAGADEYDKLTEQVQYPVLALNSYTSQLEDLYGHMDSLALNDLLDDLEYETSLFRALELHKEWLLHQYHFLHTGNKDAKVSFMAEADALVKAVEMHETAYTGRLDYRPFSFGDALREVDLSTRADKGEALRWIYFAVAVLLAAMMVSALGNSLPGWFGPFFYLLLAGVGKLDALSRDWALILMAATLVYALILWMRYMRRKPDRIAWNRSWAMLMILQVISLFFSAWRGPLALGYWFWTGNLFRIFLLAVVACLLGLHIVWAVKSAKGWATWLISFGAWISILAVGMGAFWSSLDERLTIVNAQAALLPNSIVHTWGFEQMFGIPHGLVNWVAGAGLVLILVALISLVVFRGVRERRELGEAFRRR